MYTHVYNTYIYMLCMGVCISLVSTYNIYTYIYIYMYIYLENNTKCVRVCMCVCISV